MFRLENIFMIVNRILFNQQDRLIKLEGRHGIISYLKNFHISLSISFLVVREIILKFPAIPKRFWQCSGSVSLSVWQSVEADRTGQQHSTYYRDYNAAVMLQSLLLLLLSSTKPWYSSDVTDGRASAAPATYIPISQHDTTLSSSSSHGIIRSRAAAGVPSLQQQQQRRHHPRQEDVNFVCTNYAQLNGFEL